MRKKHLLLAFALIFLIVTLCVAVACDKHTEHAFSAEWTSNETHHWHSCSGCDEKNGYATHTFGEWMTVREPQGEEDGIKKRVCSECKYTEEQTFHVHTFSTEWTNDDTYHWHAATCEHTGEISEKAEHSWVAGRILKKPTCLEKGEQEYTCLCGKTKTEEIPATGHSFSEEWTHDGTYHWHEATCEHTEEISGKAEHDLSNDECICGFTNWTEGLEYALNSDGASYYVSGIGTATDRNIVIRDMYNNKPVTAIGDNAFASYYRIYSITIPDSVISIGENAFNECRGLVNVYYKGDIASWCGISGLCSLMSNDEIPRILYINGEELVDELYIPDSVTSIGDYAFYGCRYLTSIIISEGVKTIGSDAFEKCFRLKSVTIPDSVTNIGSSAFSGCMNLTDINIPKNVTRIENRVFEGCEELTSVNIPDGVTSIGDSAFSHCDSLTSVTIPKGVTIIGDSAFFYCNKLVEVYNLSSLDIVAGSEDNGSVGYYAKAIHTAADEDSIISITEDGYKFIEDKEGNAYLIGYDGTSSKLVLPETYNGRSYAIKESAFEGRNHITSVTIPKGVTSIGDNAFSFCYRLIEVYNLSSLDIVAGSGDNGSVGYYAEVIHTATDEDSMISITKDGYKFIEDKDGNAYLIGYDGTSSELILPETYNGRSYAIGASAFSDYYDLTSVTIPDGVTGIGAFAFESCLLLKHVNIPNSVKSIGEQAFGACYALVNIEIPESVTSIGDALFNACLGLTSVTLPNNMESIGEYTFTYCISLTSVKIPDKVTIIGEGAFMSCFNLMSVNIPDTVTVIGEEAFSYCINLTNITIPESVTSIASAFEGCLSLKYNTYDNALYLGKDTNPYLVLVKAVDADITSCNIHSDTKFICASAFHDCSDLMSITIPEGVTSIGNDAFRGCSSLTSITIPDSVTGIINGLAFYGCSSLTSVIIGNGITSIENNAFYMCGSLTSVIIGDGVTSIGNSAFMSCISLTSVTIGKGVKNINGFAFSGCAELSDIYYKGTKEEWDSIEKKSKWDWNCGNYTVHCVDGDILKG
jgi:hypothetical protein